jgi:hypothetical protein
MTDADKAEKYVGPERRRSRFGWPTQTEPTTTPAGTHSHKQNNRPLGLAYVAIVLLLITNAALAYFVWQDHQYVQGRGEYRDQETTRLEQQITDAVCDLLDELPEGGLLDRPREKYGCGPGIPLDDLPADLRERYEGGTRSAPTTTAPAPTSTTQAPVGAPAVPNPPRVTPSSPPSTTPPKPTPASPAPSSPERPLTPVIEGVCQLVNVCLEENP